MQIKNWKKFQHFKDRRPPWIKLYRDLLDDDEWFTLSPASSKVLIMLWLLASEYVGVLPSKKKIAFRLRMTEKALESTLSELSHWLIQDDIKEISSQHQLGPSETEEERETEKETYPPGEKVLKVSNGKTAFPMDWKPTQDSMDSWKQWGIEPSIEFASFRDHALTNDRRCHNWEAAYRNWFRKAIKIKEEKRYVQPMR